MLSSAVYLMSEATVCFAVIDHSSTSRPQKKTSFYKLSCSLNNDDNHQLDTLFTGVAV